MPLSFFWFYFEGVNIVSRRGRGIIICASSVIESFWRYFKYKIGSFQEKTDTTKGLGIKNLVIMMSPNKTIKILPYRVN